MGKDDRANKISIEITRKYSYDYIKKVKKTIKKSEIMDNSVKDIVVSQLIKQNLNYKIPKYYTSWNNLTDTFISIIAQALEIDYVDIPLLQLSGMIGTWLENKSPLFVVTKEIVDIFTESEAFNIDDCFLKQLFSNFELLYPDILFLFPLDCQQLSFADNIFGKIDHCFVGKRKIGEVARVKLYLNAQPSHEDSFPCFIISGVTTGKFVINAGISTNGSYYDTSCFLLNDDKVMLSFRKLIAQCLLLIISKPELLIMSNEIKTFKYDTSGQGFQKPSSDKKVLYPRVLNLNYAEKTVRSDDKNGKAGRCSQSPKRPHWRLGYTVDKPIGKMKGVPKEQWERKRITVKPYLVRGNADVSDNNDQ